MGAWWIELLPKLLQWGFFTLTPILLFVGFYLTWKGRKAAHAVNAAPQKQPIKAEATKQPIAIPTHTVRTEPHPQPTTNVDNAAADNIPLEVYDMTGSDVLDYAEQYSNLPCIDDIEDELAEAAQFGKIHVRARQGGLLGILSLTLYAMERRRSIRVRPEHFSNRTFYLVSQNQRLKRNYPPSRHLQSQSVCAIVPTFDPFVLMPLAPEYTHPKFIRAEIEALWPPNR